MGQQLSRTVKHFGRVFARLEDVRISLHVQTAELLKDRLQPNTFPLQIIPLYFTTTVQLLIFFKLNWLDFFPELLQIAPCPPKAH